MQVFEQWTFFVLFIITTNIISQTCDFNILCERTTIQGSGRASSSLDSDQYPEFGFSASISASDKYIIVGEPGPHLTYTSYSDWLGRAYIYEKQPNNKYIKIKTLTSPHIDSIDSFGWSVDITDNYAIIGAPKEDFDGITTDIGAAYISSYNNITKQWNNATKLPYIPIKNDNFGYSVSISNNFIVIGSIGNDENGSSAGKIDIYKLNITSNQWILFQEIFGPKQLSNYGESVKIRDKYMIIGVPEYDIPSGPTGAGAVYIYYYNDSVWVEKAFVTASDAAPTNKFGCAVDITNDGKYAIVGAYGFETNAGKVYILKYNGTNWIEDNIIIPQDAQTNTKFGRSVSIYSQNNQTKCVVGSSENNEVASDAGAIYLYNLCNGAWMFIEKKFADDTSTSDMFGYSVSMNDKQVVVGAYKHNSLEGAVYGFNYYPSVCPILTDNPTVIPTKSTVFPTTLPSKQTLTPTLIPTTFPTNFPTKIPTIIPTNVPTINVTNLTSIITTKYQTQFPTKIPSIFTNIPTIIPTIFPTKYPSSSPIATLFPSKIPTLIPTTYPSTTPTIFPTQIPTKYPSTIPTLFPSEIQTNLTATTIFLATKNAAGAFNIFNNLTSNKSLFYLIIIIFSLSILLALISIIQTKCYKYNTDKQSSFIFLQFALCMTNIITDINICIILLRNYWINNFNQIIIYLFILNLIFLILPIIYNLKSIKHVKSSLIKNETATLWFNKLNNVILFIFITFITGDIYFTLNLINSYIFGLKIFNCGISRNIDMIKFRKIKFIGVVLLQNIPQLIISIVYYFMLLNYTGNNFSIFNSIFLSILLSLINIFIEIMSYLIYKIINYEYRIVQYSLNLTFININIDDNKNILKYMGYTNNLRNKLAKSLNITDNNIEIINIIPKSNGCSINMIHFVSIINTNSSNVEILSDFDNVVKCYAKHKQNIINSLKICFHLINDIDFNIISMNNDNIDSTTNEKINTEVQLNNIINNNIEINKKNTIDDSIVKQLTLDMPQEGGIEGNIKDNIEGNMDIIEKNEEKIENVENTEIEKTEGNDTLNIPQRNSKYDEKVDIIFEKEPKYINDDKKIDINNNENWKKWEIDDVYNFMIKLKDENDNFIFNDDGKILREKLIQYNITGNNLQNITLKMLRNDFNVIDFDKRSLIIKSIENLMTNT